MRTTHVGELRVVYSDACTEPDPTRIKPSKNRSRRVLKKLQQRFQRPCLYCHGTTVYAHPAFEANIRAATLAMMYGAGGQRINEKWGIETGRFQSSKPNLAQPPRPNTEDYRRVRDAFVGPIFRKTTIDPNAT